MDDLPQQIGQLMKRYQAPPGLKRRVRFMLDQQSQSLPDPSALPMTALTRIGMVRHAPWWSVPLSFALGLLMMGLAVRFEAREADRQHFEQQLVTSHVRSLMSGHELDIASSNRHTVKPWFIGKIDYAPVVLDYAEQGFALAGGRLDYVDGRPIAVLVYHRGGHVINLFVRPIPPGASHDQVQAKLQGYALTGWNQSGMELWAITDADASELQQFVALNRNAAPPSVP